MLKQILEFLRDSAWGGISAILGILGFVATIVRFIISKIRQSQSNHSITPNPFVITTLSHIFSGILAILTIISLIIAIISFQLFTDEKERLERLSSYNATATTQAHATAIASAIASNSYPSYLSGSGTLVFSDPLNGTRKWELRSSNEGGTCRFSNGSYYIIQTQAGYFMSCGTDGIFSNFAFEVQLTIIQGDCGGMYFRYASGHFYYFHICQDGTYKVAKYSSSSHAIILQDSSNSSIYVGLNLLSTIAVVANNNTLTFYANEKQIDIENDNSYASGSIGLIADPFRKNPTKVKFNNARVWKL